MIEGSGPARMQSRMYSSGKDNALRGSANLKVRAAIYLIDRGVVETYVLGNSPCIVRVQVAVLNVERAKKRISN